MGTVPKRPGRPAPPAPKPSRAAGPPPASEPAPAVEPAPDAAGAFAPGGLGRKVMALAGVVVLVGAGIFIGRWTVVPARTERPPEVAPKDGGGPVAKTDVPRPKTPREVRNPAVTVHGPKGQGDGGSLHPGGEDAHAHGKAPKASFVIDPAIAGDIKAILKALRGAADAADPGNLNYAQDLVRKYVTGDVTKAREVVELIRAEKDLQVLDLLVGAISQDPAVANDPGIVDSFLQMAEQGGDPNLRRESLLFLGSVGQPTGDFVARIVRLGKSDTDAGVQAGAVQALAQFASTHAEQAGAVARDLLEVAQAAHDPMVRATAVAALAAPDASEDGLRVLGGLVRGDSDSTVRIAAAEALGGVRAANRGAALTSLEAAFRQEPEEAVRRSLIYNIVRAGRADAASALERLAGVDPRLAPDIQDYLEILRSGETDPARISAEKSVRDAARQPKEVELPGPTEH